MNVEYLSGKRDSENESLGELVRDAQEPEEPRNELSEAGSGGAGHLGIWGVLWNVYPESYEQRCWNHKLLNVLDRLPKRD